MESQAKCESQELLRAAQYLRMSTEHQQYSIANQNAAIALYAAAHQILIVKSYVDPGKSGLTIQGRRALQELIQTVRSGAADFKCILVYDVSRWGRFQDMDEAAHYEYLCRAAGINVRYCGEQFENDNTLVSGLLKSMKRMMAGEYSRELSARLSAAHARLARMGFNQGSPVIYGLRRLLVDANSSPKQLLASREHKAIQTDRVIHVLGPPDEIANVRTIFDRCTKHGKTPVQIAIELNEARIPTRSGKDWSGDSVRNLIRNPKYMGTYVYAKRSKKLQAPVTVNDPERWIVKKGAIAAIISAKQFEKAQVRLDLLRPRYTDDQLLDLLRQLWKEKGTLSARLISERKGGPGICMYTNRFGSLDTAFALVGFNHSFNYSRVAELRRQLRNIERGLRSRVVAQLKARGVNVWEHRRSHVLTLNGELTVGVKVIHYRYWNTKWEKVGWHFEISFRNGIQILILACLDSGNQEIVTQYIIPKLTQLEGLYWSSVGKGRVFLEACRSDTLETFFDSVSRCPIQEVGLS
jgi:DNA invertase Pin-like site-specific DNA recombinase